MMLIQRVSLGCVIGKPATSTCIQDRTVRARQLPTTYTSQAARPVRTHCLFTVDHAHTHK